MAHPPTLLTRSWVCGQWTMMRHPYPYPHPVQHRRPIRASRPPPLFEGRAMSRERYIGGQWVGQHKSDLPSPPKKRRQLGECGLQPVVCIANSHELQLQLHHCTLCTGPCHGVRRSLPAPGGKGEGRLREVSVCGLPILFSPPPCLLCGATTAHARLRSAVPPDTLMPSLPNCTQTAVVMAQSASDREAAVAPRCAQPQQHSPALCQTVPRQESLRQPDPGVKPP